jgi:hypothetical protein
VDALLGEAPQLAKQTLFSRMALITLV